MKALNIVVKDLPYIVAVSAPSYTWVFLISYAGNRTTYGGIISRCNSIYRAYTETIGGWDRRFPLFLLHGRCVLMCAPLVLFFFMTEQPRMLQLTSEVYPYIPVTPFPTR